MNLYILHLNPTEAAKQLADLHLKKQINTIADILCSVYANGTAPRIRKNYDHTWCKWARENRFNLLWLFGHGVALCDEYTYRFDSEHPASSVIYWCKNHQYRLGHIVWDKGISPLPQVLPEAMQCDDTVQAYRTYYNLFKSQFVKWTKRDTPAWWNHETDFVNKGSN